MLDLLNSIAFTGSNLSNAVCLNLCFITYYFLLGCVVDTIKDASPLYDSVAVNKTLIDLYIKNASSLGVDFNNTLPQHKNRGSTDMGNVSRIKPSIHPFFKINSSNASNHTFKFTEAAILDENQLPTLNSAKSMAMTAIEVVCNEKILKKMKEDFQKI